MRLFLVRSGSLVYIVSTKETEQAKKFARSFLLGDPEQYVVETLTNPGDKVRFDIGMRFDD